MISKSCVGADDSVRPHRMQHFPEIYHKPARTCFLNVGADAHFGAKSCAMRGCASKLACGYCIGPAECAVFTVIFGEFVTSQWVDVGIDPYRGST